jgi:transposase, IS5 family
MIRYKSNNQISIEEFQTPFQMKLDKDNRWVKLSQTIPWDNLAEVYYRSMSVEHGKPSIDARRIIGSIIIKHKLKLSDEETVMQIQENPYLQYFLGYSSYESDSIFSPTLLVEIRKRIGIDKFNEMSTLLIDQALRDSEQQNSKKSQETENQINEPPHDTKSEDDHINEKEH